MDSDLVTQRWSGRSLRAPPGPVFHDLTSMNKWKSVKFHSRTTVRLGRASGNVGRKTASLWLWLQGCEEETGTLLSQMDSKMADDPRRRRAPEASFQRIFWNVPVKPWKQADI